MDLAGSGCRSRINRIKMRGWGGKTGVAHNFWALAHNFDLVGFYAILLLRHKKIYPASRDISEKFFRETLVSFL